MPSELSIPTVSVGIMQQPLHLIYILWEECDGFPQSNCCAEGRRPLGRPRRRCVDIRMDLQEVGCGYMDWIGLAQDRDRWQTLVSAAMNLWVP